MTNEREYGKFEFEPEFDFGDLVRVAGYYPQVFRVLGYRCEAYFYSDEEWSELVYELADAYTAEWMEADEQDLVLVAEADNAEEYLNGIGQPTIDLTELIIGVDWAKGEDRTMYGKQPKEPRKPTARELSAQEAERRKAGRLEKSAQIDNLLDIANWNRKKFAETGEQEYAAKIAEVEAELKKITEGDGE